MHPPIIIFAYNRPKHLKRLVDSLLSNAECADTDLIIYADGAKTAGDTNVVEVAKVINQITGFKQVTPIFRDKNIGLAANIIDGVTSTINTYGTAIVLEDDLLVTPHFIKYMREALIYYKDKKIFSIAGYTPKVDLPADYHCDTYAIMRNCSWGWATWQDRWALVDWEVKDFAQFFADSKAVSEFNKAGNDLSTMLLKQQKGQIGSWSIRFCYTSFRSQMPTIYPVKSFVTNGGADGTGSNIGNTSKYQTMTMDSYKEMRFCDNLDTNPHILKSFRRTYDTSLQRRIINIGKRLMWKIFGK
ncbi:MAG: glycosyltransferase [Bacteroidales bacterium]|nr:glycosyltransferase [Bacteroidales bacterium]